MEMALRFQQQVILLTGGTGALGSAVARAFLQEGAEVIVTYRSRQEYEELQNTVPADRGRVRGEQIDVTSEAEMQRLVAAVAAQSHRLDVLVNTVGGYSGGARLWEVESAALDRMLDLNLRSVFVSSRCALPIMLRQGSGCMINVAARAAVDQPGGAGAYVAAKAAAVALMHSLAMDLQGTAIRVNSVLPNIIDTSANRRAMPRADFATWTKPEEIARVILFLCTPDAAAYNGAAIAF